MERTCQQCERTLNKNSFGKNQWKRKDKISIRCKDCTSLTNSTPRKKLKSGILIKASKIMIDTNVKINSNNNVGEGGKGKTSSSNSNSNSNSDSISRETQNEKDSRVKVTKKIQKKKDEKKKCKKEELGPELIKIKLIERINVLSDSERKIFQLEWTSLAISESDEKIVADNVIVNGWYGPMDANELLQMRDHVKSTQMTVPQAISLRSAYLQQKGMVSVKKNGLQQICFIRRGRNYFCFCFYTLSTSKISHLLVSIVFIICLMVVPTRSSSKTSKEFVQRLQTGMQYTGFGKEV